MASAVLGTLATTVTRSEPGLLLGLPVIAGTVAAALAVRPRKGWMILPVPALVYLVGALTSGIIFNRSSGSSGTALVFGAAQWIANGFFAMVLATVLAISITTARWYLWRRRRQASGAPGWPPPADQGRSRADRTAWGDPDRRGQGPRPESRPGPYNFSSGA